MASPTAAAGSSPKKRGGSTGRRTVADVKGDTTPAKGSPLRNTTPSNPQQSPSARKVKKGKEDKKGKKEKKPRYERTRALVGWAAGEVADRTGITWAYGHLMVRRTPQPPQPPPPAC